MCDLEVFVEGRLFGLTFLIYVLTFSLWTIEVLFHWLFYHVFMPVSGLVGADTKVKVLIFDFEKNTIQLEQITMA